MTFAEILLLICLCAGIYYSLRPLRQFVERLVLNALGRHPKWVDAIIVPRDGD